MPLIDVQLSYCLISDYYDLSKQAQPIMCYHEQSVPLIFDTSCAIIISKNILSKIVKVCVFIKIRSLCKKSIFVKIELLKGKIINNIIVK